MVSESWTPSSFSSHLPSIKWVLNTYNIVTPSSFSTHLPSSKWVLNTIIFFALTLIVVAKRDGSLRNEIRRHLKRDAMKRDSRCEKRHMKRDSMKGDSRRAKRRVRHVEKDSIKMDAPTCEKRLDQKRLLMWKETLKETYEKRLYGRRL